MSKLRFTDGEEFDTSGPLRKEKRYDGWYVLGEGKLIPVSSEKEADSYIRVETAVDKIKKSETPQKEFFNQIGKILRR
jgi:hypothetical protein